MPIFMLALVLPITGCDPLFERDYDSELAKQLCELEFKLEEVQGYTRNLDAQIRNICRNHPADCPGAPDLTKER